MRTMPQKIIDALATNDFTGPRKATLRVTIQKFVMGIENVGDQVYASLPFHTGLDPARELPNARSLTTDRAIDTDTATAQLTLFNTLPLPPGTGPDKAGSFDLLGYYTFNRGRTPYSVTEWGHEANQWQDFLVPDRLIRTYQGYGADYSVVPELDPNLVQTGMWLIDDVVYAEDGTIQVEMRDLSRLLTDHIMFPPVVPIAHYPLVFEQERTVITSSSSASSPTTTTGAQVSGAQYVRPTYAKDSNYTESKTQAGHHPKDAFDANAATYWLSTGNEQPSGPAIYEWVEGSLPAGSQKVRAVRFKAWAGPYTAFLSLMVGGKWTGTTKIPYDASADRGGTSNFSDITYIKSLTVSKDGEAVFVLTSDVLNVQAIRITLTNLYNSGIAGLNARAVYRGGIRTIEYSPTAPVAAPSTAAGTGTTTTVSGLVCPANVVSDFRIGYAGGTVTRVIAKIPVMPPEGCQVRIGANAKTGITLTSADALAGFPGYYSRDNTGSIAVGTKVRLYVGNCYREATVTSNLPAKVPDPSPNNDGITTFGNYSDYSQIVKRLLAYGGFFWPRDGKQILTDANTATFNWLESDPFLSTDSAASVVAELRFAYLSGTMTYDQIRAYVDRLKYANETQHFVPLPTPPGTDDAFLTGDDNIDFRINQIFEERGVRVQAGGRVWGDILMSGTSGPAKLDADVWDKKPLQDGINYVKDILGFIFYIDELGGAQFRLPNVYRRGNWSVGTNSLDRTRTPTVKVFDDLTKVLTLKAKLSSRNTREKVFVANVNGKIGAVARGRNPFPSGLRRVAGWTDQRFESEAECIVMADLIALRQLFTYRQDSVRIPADPSIQIDDQIELRERTTGEAYLHYVRAIRSEWQLESGIWTYDLTTSWLGVDPEGEWAFRSASLQQDTQSFLAALGEI